MELNAASTEQLGLLFGITERRVRQLSEQGILARLKTADGHPVPGRYDLVKSIRAYCKYLRELTRIGDPQESLFRKLQNRRMVSEVEFASLKLTCLRRRLHDARDVQFLMETLFSAIRSRLLQIPQRTPSLLAGKTTYAEIHGVLRDEIERALSELAEHAPAGGQLEQYLSS